MRGSQRQAGATTLAPGPHMFPLRCVTNHVLRAQLVAKTASFHMQGLL